MTSDPAGQQPASAPASAPAASPGPEAETDTSRTVLLLRHARSTANVAGILAGRSPGVILDESGTQQAAGLPARLADVPIARIASSPLERCLLTLQPLADAKGLPVDVEPDLAEVDYGDWTGRRLADLAGEPIWRTVQAHASAASFPGGESLAAVSARSVAAVRRQLAQTTGEGALLLCAHGDVIKAVLADALGLHLDQFQRISVAPASISAIRYTPHRPFVQLLGDTGTLGGLVPLPAETADRAASATGPGTSGPSGPAASDAVPGGVA